MAAATVDPQVGDLVLLLPAQFWKDICTCVNVPSSSGVLGQLEIPGLRIAAC